MRLNMKGGLADGMSPKDFDRKTLAQGIEVELEHTSDRKVAREIAMDHLVEDPAYYDKLEIMEGKRLSTYQMAWAALSLAGSGAGAYHGYRRNAASSPMLWGLGWAIFGGMLPVIAVPLALAQGFGKAKV